MVRRIELTPELQMRIVESVRRGNYIEVACEACGVDRETGYDWLDFGDMQTAGIYRDFLEAVLHARAELEDELLSVIKAAAATDPKAAQWLLERARFCTGRSVKALDELREDRSKTAWESSGGEQSDG